MHNDYFIAPTTSRNDLYKMGIEKYGYFYPEQDNFTSRLGTNKDTIKIVKNFIDQEEINLLLTRARSAHENIPCDHNVFDTAGKLILFYKNKMKQKAEELFNVELKDPEFYNDPNDVSVYLACREPGYVTNIHSDNLSSNNEQNEKYGWSGHLSNLLYLNNDFNGGELYFPEHDLMIKPEPGMLVSFPGNIWNRHGILPADKHRYAISIFFEIKDFI